MVRRHRRFELLQVTLDETPIGSCTIDAWEDDDGREQWTARVLMKTGHGSTEGVLHGLTRSGENLKGQVRFAYVGETWIDRPSMKAILKQLDELQDAKKN